MLKRTATNHRYLPALAKMVDAVHEHGALAGIELVYPGINGPNLYSKEVPRAPTALPIRTFTNDPVHARAMDLEDIRDLRRWHRNAALRAKTAGFDIVYVYATHGYLLSQFLSGAMNHRSDEYGGTLENRARMLMRKYLSP